MSSPFPGMDPYLETSEFWRGFQLAMMASISSQFNTNLPQNYAAKLEERGFIGTAWKAIGPDDTDFYEIKERYLEIVTGVEWKEVVAVVEILSSANKSAGAMRSAYIRNQREILCRGAHLLEIDLLREGNCVVIPPSILKPKWSYSISLSRNGRRVPLDVWPLTLRKPLPRIALPLKPGDPDFALDLQEAFERAYEAGPYARSIDYAQPPAFPLEGEDAAWADSMLREKGLRGTVSAPDTTRL